MDLLLFTRKGCEVSRSRSYMVVDRFNFKQELGIVVVIIVSKKLEKGNRCLMKTCWKYDLIVVYIL